jgi:hypothetical protein
MNPELVDQTCVLVPGEVHLAATGSEVGMYVVIAGVLIAVGVVLLALVVLTRRRSNRQLPKAARAAASVGVALLMIFGLSVAAPSVGGASAATEPIDTGCDLISWQVTSNGLSTPIDETPTEVLAVNLTNVSSFPIEVAFNTEVTADTGNLSDYVSLVGDCPACTPTTTVLNRILSAPTVGPTVQLAAGQAISISFVGSLIAAAPNSAQDQSAEFSLIASTRQIE